jgi:hypothetical protein
MQFRDFLAAEFPGDEIEQLSGSNNLVYLVRTSTGPIVAKHVVDADIPLSYLAEANRRLADHLPVQQILRVFETARDDPFDAVFAEYVAGVDLADVLTGDAEGELPMTELAEYLARFVVACRDLPKMHGSFGMYKRDAPTFAAHVDYVVHYGRRYWGRVRPFYAGTPVADAIDAWLDGGFARAAGRHPAPYSVVPIDANLKNFILTPEGRIVVLNVPIAAVSTPAHAVAAISTHLRNREHHAHFLKEAAARVLADDAEMVPHFEMWLLLGILSFYAVRQPDRQAQWRDWGAPVPLSDDFTGLVGGLLLGPGRP